MTTSYQQALKARIRELEAEIEILQGKLATQEEKLNEAIKSHYALEKRGRI